MKVIPKVTFVINFGSFLVCLSVSCFASSALVSLLLGFNNPLTVVTQNGHKSVEYDIDWLGEFACKPRFEFVPNKPFHVVCQTGENSSCAVSNTRWLTELFLTIAFTSDMNANATWKMLCLQRTRAECFVILSESNVRADVSHIYM